MFRTFKRRSNRIKPLLNYHGVWSSHESTYPDYMMIAMRDGRVVRYARDIRPIRLNVGKNGWQFSGHIAVGYQYKEKPLKKMTGFLQRLR